MLLRILFFCFIAGTIGIATANELPKTNSEVDFTRYHEMFVFAVEDPLIRVKVWVPLEFVYPRVILETHIDNDSVITSNIRPISDILRNAWAVRFDENIFVYLDWIEGFHRELSTQILQLEKDGKFVEVGKFTSYWESNKMAEGIDSDTKRKFQTYQMKQDEPIWLKKSEIASLDNNSNSDVYEDIEFKPFYDSTSDLRHFWKAPTIFGYYSKSFKGGKFVLLQVENDGRLIDRLLFRSEGSEFGAWSYYSKLGDNKFYLCLVDRFDNARNIYRIFRFGGDSKMREVAHYVDRQIYSEIQFYCLYTGLKNPYEMMREELKPVPRVSE